MARMTSELVLFRKKIKRITYFWPFFYFVYLLPRLINEKPPTTLSVSGEGAIEHFFGAKIWLYGFDSVFWQVLIDFSFVVFLLFISAKNIIRTDLNPLL